MSKNLTRVLVALLLLVTLTAGAAQAAPWSLGGPDPSPLAALWSWVVSLFQSSTAEECETDANDDCRGGESPDEGDEGDEGSGMDPNG